MTHRKAIIECSNDGLKLEVTLEPEIPFGKVVGISTNELGVTTATVHIDFPIVSPVLDEIPPIFHDSSWYDLWEDLLGPVAEATVVIAVEPEWRLPKGA